MKMVRWLRKLKCFGIKSSILFCFSLITQSAFAVESVNGKFVHILHPGFEKVLNVVELEVFCQDGAGLNVAVDGVANGIGRPSRPAGRGIDGGKENQWGDNTTACFSGDNPAWEVDLKAVQQVERLVVYTRLNHDARLHGAQIMVLDEDRKVVWQSTLDAKKFPQTLLIGDDSEQGSHLGKTIPLMPGKYEKGVRWVKEAVVFDDRELHPDLENQKVFQRNKEEPHATLMPFESAASALKGRRCESIYYKSLNGPWKFSWAKRPEERKKDFYKENYDVSEWDTIDVPCSWQMRGYGTPIYSNSKYPFAPHAPRVMDTPPETFTSFEDRNPVGSYRRNMTIPENWDGREIFVTFAGVESAFYLWVNGQKVGYSQGSKLPAEFNITKYIRKGNNSISAEVYRWCDGSYLEDQDFFRLSGISRDVYLWSAPKQHVRDFSVVTELDENYVDAELKVRAKVVNYGHSEQACKLEVSLFDNEGNPVVSPVSEDLQSHPETEVAVGFTMPLTAPNKWSDETPYLYKLLLTLKDADENILEVIPQNVGVREVEVKNNQVLVNGKAVYFKGVNRHEHNPETGHYVTRELRIKDILLMKQNNINAVRTAHYPNDAEWYDLCDEYGIFLCDEANTETHGLQELSSNPEWADAYFERIRRMVIRDKNHPSVIYWSLTNESGPATNLKPISEWIGENDPQGRPRTHYGQINSPMYIQPKDLDSIGRRSKVPFILCEYAHSMGNSTGNLADYWDMFKAHAPLQGGFVWDWVDQGLKWEIPGQPGKYFWARGDDIEGAYPNDGYFCFNGLVGPDRVPHPGLSEFKKVAQGIHVAADDLSEGRFKITNEYFFRNLDMFFARWELAADGTVLKEGTLDLDLAPRESRSYTLPVKAGDLPQGKELIIKFTFSLKEDRLWAPQGHIVAWDQIQYPAAGVKRTVNRKEEKLTIQKNGKDLIFKGKNFSARINEQTGLLESYVFDGQELLLDPLTPNFWRGRTDNDLAWTKGKSAYEKWEALDKNKVQLKSLRIEEQDVHRVRISADMDMGAIPSTYTLEYTINGNGLIQVAAVYTPVEYLDTALRIGLTTRIPRAFDAIKWYGRGPHESYADRKTGASIGIWERSVEEMQYGYTRPQENGNRTDTRWFSIAGENNTRLNVMGNTLINFSAWPYTQEDLSPIEGHSNYKLPRRDFVTLNIDYGQLGLGGDTTWGLKARPYKKYHFTKEGEAYRYAFTLFAEKIK